VFIHLNLAGLRCSGSFHGDALLNETLISQLQTEISELEGLLADKKRLLVEAQAQSSIQESKDYSVQPEIDSPEKQSINNHSSPEEKIVLFRSLFRGREDVFAKRFESRKTGKSGYQPFCRNEWARGICGKPKITCGSCTNRAFVPISDVGRLNRTYYGKTEIRVYDYVDDKVPVLSRMYGRRFKGYKALGFTITRLEKNDN
jgi:hypothetical protein